MICKSCRHEIETHHRFCPHCGASIEQKEIIVSDEEDRASTAPEEEPEAPTSSTGRDVDGTKPDAYAYRSYQDFQREMNKPSRVGRTLGIIAICLSAAALLLLVFYYVMPFILEGLTPAPSPSHNAPIAYSDPVVVVDRSQAEPAHRIYFYGGKGESIHIPELNITLPIENGIAEYSIPDAHFLDRVPGDEPKKEVVLATRRILADGTSLSIPDIHYAIDVPQAPVAFIDPAVTRVETAADQYTLQFKVLPGSTVFVGGDNVTDLIASTGEVSRKIALQQPETTIEVRVSTDYHRPASHTLVFIQSSRDIPLSFGRNIQWTTHEDHLTVSGTTEPGATLRSNLPTAEDILVAEDGSFSFTILLERYGKQALTITATNEAGQSSTMTQEVNRQPDLDAYTKAAWKMDYPALAASGNNWIGRIFLCDGVVETLERHGGVSTFILHLGNDQRLVMEYDGSVELREGQAYRMYADVLGKKDGLPLLAARFVYKQ